MEINWSYCVAEDGDGLLLVNGKVYRVNNIEEALDLLQRFYDEMEKPVE